MIKKIFGILVIVVCLVFIINNSYAQDIPFVIKLTGDLNLENSSEQNVTMKVFVNDNSDSSNLIFNVTKSKDLLNTILFKGVFTDPIDVSLTGTAKTFKLIVTLQSSPTTVIKSKEITLANPNYVDLNYKADEVVDNALNNSNFVNSAITGDKIKNSTITSDKIDSIFGFHIKDGAITEEKIISNTFENSKFINYSLDYTDFIIGSGEINSYLGKNSAGDKFIILTTIPTIAGINAGAGISKSSANPPIFSITEKGITKDMIANNNILDTHLANESVTSDKILSNSVVTSKFADSAVDTDDIDKVTTSDFYNNSVTMKKLSDKALSALFCNSLEVPAFNTPGTIADIYRISQECEFTFNDIDLEVKYDEFYFERVTNSGPLVLGLTGSDKTAEAFCNLHGGKFKEFGTNGNSVGVIAWNPLDNGYWQKGTANGYISTVTCTFNGISKFSNPAPID